MENSMSTLSAGLLLFLIMDPLGNIPLFLSLLRNVDAEASPARARARAANRARRAVRVPVLRALPSACAAAQAGVGQHRGRHRAVPDRRAHGVSAGRWAASSAAIRIASRSSCRWRFRASRGRRRLRRSCCSRTAIRGARSTGALRCFVAWFATAVILLSSTYLFSLSRYERTDRGRAAHGHVARRVVGSDVSRWRDGVCAHGRCGELTSAVIPAKAGIHFPLLREDQNGSRPSPG